MIGGKFEHEYQRRRAGLAVYDAYSKPLDPAIEHWVASLTVTDAVRATMDHQIRRAVDVLKLSTFADLHDIQRLERNLLALDGKPGPRRTYNKLTLRTGFQKPLKQFTKWCTRNRRYLPEDPLAQWDLIRLPENHPRRPRRALSPEEMARALLAAEALDVIYERSHPTAIFFLTLLVVGARFGAIGCLDVPSLLRERSKLDLGPSVGKKRKGEASLDPRTLIELTVYVGQRQSSWSSSIRDCIQDERTNRMPKRRAA